MEYRITLETFEGPMDLLLHLIEKAQINIYDIPINEITEQYLDYLSKMDEMDLEITSEFLVMAATLLEIKSKLLLPKTKKEQDVEQLEMEELDPRLELIRSLVEYKKYKHASAKLRDYEEIQSKVYYKPKEDLSEFTTDDDSDLIEMDLDKLVSVFKKLILKNKDKENLFKFNEIEKDEYTLEECTRRIKSRLKKSKIIGFYDLFNDNSSRNEIIAIFLSILELVKNKYIAIYQKKNFDDILIKRLSKEGEGNDRS